MVQTTSVATEEVIGQGSELWVSFDNRATWEKIPGLEKIPAIGLEGNLIAFMSIDELEERSIAGVDKSPEWAMVFRRIGNSTVQDQLMDAGDDKDKVDLQARYTSGDIFTIKVQLAASKMEEVDQGDGFLLAGVAGKQDGKHERTKV